MKGGNQLSGLRRELEAAGDPERARFLQGFFKTGPGQYAEGDVMMGISVPVQRKIAKRYQALEAPQISTLLASPLHEERLTALIILVDQFGTADAARQERIVEFYLSKTDRINNWDLVDASARPILGTYLADKDRSILYKLAGSASLWERRIAIVATHAFIQRGEFADTLRISEALLADPQDLIHKACGWMLREVGKRSKPDLEEFLKHHSSQMPRTMLRYAIERFGPAERQMYLQRL